ncbi:MAG: glycosyltransferase family 4 protein [Bacteroidia bacterium]|nr:glycosyltransferase family 4 protein [Bacteroidia bacterium]
MRERIQVVCCTDGIFPESVGGMQRFARLLIESLAATGELDLIVIHPHGDRQLFDPALGIREHAVPPLPGKRLYIRELYDYSVRVSQVLRSYPDALIYSQGLSVWHRAGHLRKRLIVHPHGLEPFQVLTLSERLRTLPLKWALISLFNQAGTVVSLGGRLTGIIRRHLYQRRTRVAVIPNATVPPEAAAPAPQLPGEPIRCLFVGRFALNKGIDVLMQAIRRLRERHPAQAFTFTLAGKGELYESYRKLYAGEGIEFLGFVTDEQLAELYRSHHLFVLPTLFEGMPTVILEAMAQGMPVVVSDVGATAELVDARNGFLTEARNADQLVEAIEAFAAMDAAQRQALSEQSQRKVEERYTWPRVAAQYLELFRGLRGQTPVRA